MLVPFVLAVPAVGGYSSYLIAMASRPSARIPRRGSLRPAATRCESWSEPQMTTPPCPTRSGRQTTPPCPTRSGRPKWRQCASPTSTRRRMWSSGTSSPEGAGVLPRERRDRGRTSAHLPGLPACRRPRCQGPCWRTTKNYSPGKKGAADADLRPATSSSLRRARTTRHRRLPSSAELLLRPAPSQHIRAPYLRLPPRKKDPCHRHGTGLATIIPATSYSPRGLPPKYHRRWWS